MTMYDHARSLHEERLRAAEQARLAAEVRSASRARRVEADEENGWRVAWSSSDLTGKAVAIVNRVTGEKRIGRDPADWDRALAEAVRKLRVGV